MTVQGDQSFVEEIRRLSRRIVGVPELEMRVSIWREYFDRHHPDTLLACVNATVHSLSEGQEWGRLAMLAFARFMSVNKDSVRQRLLPIAVVRAATDVIALLSDEQPARVAEPDELKPPAVIKDRDVTLGERRAFARSSQRHLLDRLLADPDPVVVNQLLANPRIVERDVLAIASRRPVSQDIILTVFKNDKWIRLRSIQLAIIQNPYSPVHVALALTGLVDEDGLRQVVSARTIHRLIRSTAKKRLRGRIEPGHPIVIGAEQIEWIENVLNRREGNDK